MIYIFVVLIVYISTSRIWYSYILCLYFVIHNTSKISQYSVLPSLYIYMYVLVVLVLLHGIICTSLWYLNASYFPKISFS